MDRAALRAAFRGQGDTIEKPVPFTVPGFGPVFLKLFSAARATANQKIMSAAEHESNRIVVAAALVLCDGDGELLYDVNDADDLAELGRVKSITLQLIVREATRLNGQSDEGATEAGNG